MRALLLYHSVDDLRRRRDRGHGTQVLGVPRIARIVQPPPDGSVSGESVIAVHCEAPLPRLLSRIAPLSALTMSGVAMT